MSDTPYGDDLVRTFLAEQAGYRELSLRTAELLKRLLHEQSVQFHAITHRTKSPESLAGKLGRRHKQYHDLQSITDLAGVRVTTLFASDVIRVAAIVEQEFDVDRINSIDKRKALEPDRFGYQSLHYVVRFRTDRQQLQEHSHIADRPVEIQIRSILQHAWAEIEHDLGYKFPLSVPRHIRRRFARVAGLLEVVDDEFDALRAELLSYQGSVSDRIAVALGTLAIDLPSLREAAHRSPALATLDRAIAARRGVRLEEDLSGFYEEELEFEVALLSSLGITTVRELELLATAHCNEVVLFAECYFIFEYNWMMPGFGLLALCCFLVARTGGLDVILNHLTETQQWPKQEERNEVASGLWNAYLKMREQPA